MSRFREITARFHVTPQIDTDLVASLPGEGYDVLICNRPDGEVTDQPTAEEMAQAAADHGLIFVHIPVLMPDITAAMVRQMHAATKGRRALAYCASGTRSTLLYVISAVQQGDMELDEALHAANRAGYDLEGVRPLIVKLSGQ
jgi:uncharacterized protein (TIGR01244 family)